MGLGIRVGPGTSVPVPRRPITIRAPLDHQGPIARWNLTNVRLARVTPGCGNATARGGAG
jgi:hypothetical protein